MLQLALRSRSAAACLEMSLQLVHRLNSAATACRAWDVLTGAGAGLPRRRAVQHLCSPYYAAAADEMLCNHICSSYSVAAALHCCMHSACAALRRMALRCSLAVGHARCRIRPAACRLRSPSTAATLGPFTSPPGFEYDVRLQNAAYRTATHEAHTILPLGGLGKKSAARRPQSACCTFTPLSRCEALQACRFSACGSFLYVASVMLSDHSAHAAWGSSTHDDASNTWPRRR